ncbi:hypothetical protein J7E96_02255 [Streptomyces sp. ISL-96]|uniref:hypothetical protein n=1 Tax=Streptomyces sp. ISL-96 TaxID=2819191 RepID=UPI001BE7A6F6|nr:hypothetical protein [Streptomyces sp. ISL-96]MBT2487381.1 hypothetical protein [Streptomyces sp. ISL-96]
MGAVARRPIAAVAAALLFVEAVGIVFVHWILGKVVNSQSMSLAGLDSDVMSTSTYLMGGGFGLYLVACGVLLLRAAVSDRPPGRLGRILLIACAVVHGVLGALCVGLVGWAAFVAMMVTFGLVVLSVIAYGKRDERGGVPGSAGASDTPPAGPESGTPVTV